MTLVYDDLAHYPTAFFSNFVCLCWLMLSWLFDCSVDIQFMVSVNPKHHNQSLLAFLAGSESFIWMI